jgi:hypothetical protein
MTFSDQIRRDSNPDREYLAGGWNGIYLLLPYYFRAGTGGRVHNVDTARLTRTLWQERKSLRGRHIDARRCRITEAPDAARYSGRVNVSHWNPVLRYSQAARLLSGCTRRAISSAVLVRARLVSEVTRCAGALVAVLWGDDQAGEFCFVVRKPQFAVGDGVCVVHQ